MTAARAGRPSGRTKRGNHSNEDQIPLPHQAKRAHPARKKSTSDTGSYKSEEAAAAVLAKHRTQLAALQDVFYASQTKALLIVLQGMDTAGKDGTISHIFSGINPQGCDVASFKVPTPLEARHDFLWRAPRPGPAPGHDQHLQPLPLRRRPLPARPQTHHRQSHEPPSRRHQRV
ncbi:hypothetical protein RBB78_01345 [Tunturiibacter empetritectus]|uniref:hypothetical protein n=1 Tax=Tunturiibacter empetritectus TaxID=3069691 RepID=UPI003D9B60FC